MKRRRKTHFLDSNSSEAKKQRKKIIVNVGGFKFKLFFSKDSKLNRFPETRLTKLLNRATDSTHDDLSTLCDDYDDIQREFYFDRDPGVFKSILKLYYYGEIHIPHGFCLKSFMQEMEYWEIDEKYLHRNISCRLNEMKTKQAEKAEKIQIILSDQQDDETLSRAQRWQIFLEKLMKKPESSFAACVISVVSIIFILISSVVLCVSTIPELQVRDEKGNNEEHPTLKCIETTCLIWFTLEYILRFVASSNKCHFLFSLENTVDFLVIVPFYLELIFTHLITNVVEIANVHKIMQTCHIMRVLRIFKLVRHSSRLQTLALALKNSVDELGLLIMFLSIWTLLVSALLYSVEQNHSESMFTSIPQTFWWAITTMTTVGYGDVCPKTDLGKFTAAVGCVCGIIFVAIPIHLIITNIHEAFNKHEIAVRHEVGCMRHLFSFKRRNVVFCGTE